MVAAARWLEELGCDYVVHHIGYDERRALPPGDCGCQPAGSARGCSGGADSGPGGRGLSLEQAIRCPEYGAPLVVLGAPLTIDADAFRTADGNLEASLRLICDKVHAYEV